MTDTEYAEITAAPFVYRLRYYLARLPWIHLADLAVRGIDGIGGDRLHAWLTTEAQAELDRQRRHREGRKPEEAPPLTIDFTNWSDRDLGAALVATDVTARTFSDPDLGALLDVLHSAVCQQCKIRLTILAEGRP